MKGTLAQKILARASGKTEVRAGEYVIGNIDRALTREHIAEIVYTDGVTRIWDPSKVVVVLDHEVPAPSVAIAESYKKGREAARRVGIENFFGEGSGICHQIMVENGFALPGDLIVGTDSHTTTYGALGAAGTGIGSSEMAYVMATGKLWFKVPETIKFTLSGRLNPRVMSKDIILYIAGKYSCTAAQYKAIEFTGPVASEMSLASRLTVSNMAMEIGAKFAFFEPDEKVEAYLATRAKRPYTMIKPDKDAQYESEYEIDVTNLEPQVALPYSVDNVKPVSKIGEIKVSQALLGSCTNGRIEDLRIAAEIMKGKKVNPDTKCFVIPASADVYQEALADGILATLVKSGAVICNPGCGSCYGGCMGVLAAGESCIASINRNFKGRMGSSQANVYLVPPAVVAASAIEGKIADPRGY